MTTTVVELCVGSGLVTPGTVETTSTTGSTPKLRVRPVLKPSTPTQELKNPIPPKQSPGVISFIAQSSSVVAPLRDGNAACMLFSQADVRLPGTAPLSSRSYHGKGIDCGRYTPTCGREKRTHSSGTSTLTRKSDTAWLPSPASDTAIPSASCSSPPRLAALSPAALTRPTSVVKKTKPAGSLNGKGVAPSGWSARKDTNCVTDSAAMESRGINKGRLAKTRKHGFESMPMLEKPRIGETDHMANHRTRGESQQPRKQKGQPTTPHTDTQEDKTLSFESLKSGAHTGMSVTEFADKVAALAAEVAKVFGRKPVSQSANCRNYGLE